MGGGKKKKKQKQSKTTKEKAKDRNRGQSKSTYLNKSLHVAAIAIVGPHGYVRSPHSTCQKVGLLSHGP